MWRIIATMICGWCEQIQPGGAGGVYTLVFATLCCQDTVRIMPYRFSIADETVATRPPWLDSSLPRLPCRCISGFLEHNSTVSKQLRYSLTREYICQPFVENEAPSYCQQKRKQPPSSRPKIASSNLHFTTILAHKPFFYSFLIKIHTFSYIFY